MAKRGTLAERFWPKVWKQYGCWMWIGAIKGNGYGTIGRGGQGAGMVYAHRASWQIHNGEIPDGLMVLHRCDVRACVNPDHLFLGTNADNLHDCSLKGRMHPGEQNPAAKLNERQVVNIRVLASSGTRHRVLAEAFGVARQTISKIVTRRKWKLTV